MVQALYFCLVVQFLVENKLNKGDKAMKNLTMEELNREIEKIEEEKFIYLMTCDKWDSQEERKYDKKIHELRCEKGHRVLKSGINCALINKRLQRLDVYFYNESACQFEHETYYFDFLREYAIEHGDEKLWDSASSCVTNYVIEWYCYDDMCIEFENSTTLNELLEIIDKTLV